MRLTQIAETSVPEGLVEINPKAGHIWRGVILLQHFSLDKPRNDTGIFDRKMAYR